MPGMVERRGRWRAPGWAQVLNRWAGRIIGDPPEPGNREAPEGRVALNVAIDLHKGATGLFVLGLMTAYDIFTPSAQVYLALHGSYGIAWLVKDVTVGDRKWRRRVGPLRVLGAWTFLTLYWVAPFLLIGGQARSLELGPWGPAGPAGLSVAVVLYVVGLVLMIGADAQKNTRLAAQGDEGLIVTGFFARIRHPNYLGEMMIYGSFAVVVNHWVPWVILAAIWVLFFLPNMLAIESSLSRYPGFEEWKGRTGFLLPRIRR